MAYSPGRKVNVGRRLPPRLAYCANCKAHRELLSRLIIEDNQTSAFRGMYVCSVCYDGPAPQPPEVQNISGPEGGPSEEKQWL